MSSDPLRATLSKWWHAVAKSIRDLHHHKAIPEDLKAALKGRSRLYASTVEKSPDLVDHVAEAPDVGAQARDLGGDTRPAKRSRQPVSRHRSVASSLSSSRQVEPDDGLRRSMLSPPRSGRSGSRVSGTALDLADSSSGSVGAVCGFTEEEVRRLKPLLQRLLERL